MRLLHFIRDNVPVDFVMFSQRGKTAEPLMSVAAFIKAHLALVLFFSVSAALAQSPAKKDEASQDFAREGVVIEQCATRVAFKSDGTSTTDFHARIRVRTDGGVQLNGQGVETILHSFNGNDGELPAAPLIRDSLGNLYGTASAYFTGGGVVFKINP